MPDENRRKRYPPIEEHGVIGDLHTVALVGDGRHDRLVLLPELRLAERLRARSSTPTRGGYYRIAPAHTGATTSSSTSPTRTS